MTFIMERRIPPEVLRRDMHGCRDVVAVRTDQCPPRLCVVVTKLPNLYALKAEYKKLDEERERLSEQYNEVKKELKEYGIVKQNVDSILRATPGKEHTQEL